MSAAHDSHGHDDPGHDHAEAFDPEPATALGEGEPQTPAWLPVLGVGALLVGAVWFLSGDSSAGPSAASSAPSSATAAARAPEAGKPAMPPRTAAPRPPGGTASPSSLPPPQDPAERAKLLEALKKKREQAAGKVKEVVNP